MSRTFKNPILRGYHPDPSICRVEDDFYLVTSTNSFFPGVPLYHSRDLVNWELKRYILDRPSQIPLKATLMAGGIYAPTLRYHNGVFYMITTNANCGGNFVVTTRDIEGDWSEPHWIENAPGIDPSLFWDDDGKCYYTGTSRELGIWVQEFDDQNYRLIGERTCLWRGALHDCWSPEAPHIIKKYGWYYLMIAEGGTEQDHAVTIARSPSITGPYVGNEANPILTHRHLGMMYPLSNMGHADLVELKDGSWYMVLLGTRIYGGYHKNLGRETFLAPVVWEAGWPVVNPMKGIVELVSEAPNLPEHPFKTSSSPKQDFLSPVFNHLGTPVNHPCRVENGELFIRCLKASVTPGDPNASDEGAFPFYGRRQQHMSFRASVLLDVPRASGASCGIMILQNAFCQLRFEIVNESGTLRARAEQYEKDTPDIMNPSSRKRLAYQEIHRRELFSCPVSDFRNELTLSAKGQEITLLLNGKTAAQTDGGFLGSETSGGFIGSYIGLFASGNGQDMDAEARFLRMDYEGLDD